MKKQITQQSGFWLIVGLLAGVAVSYLVPSEPVLAAGSDRDNGGKFAVVTVPTEAGQPDAVFVLDFLTSRLYGAALNSQSAKFTQFYQRNIAADFQLPEGAKPRYVMTSGFINLNRRGSMQPAKGGLYIGELNSGRMHAYTFPYSNRNKGGNAQVVLVNAFQFREAVE